MAPQGQPLAAFVCPGHPLLDSVLDITLERNADLLKRGAVLVDEGDTGTRPRVLFYLEHSVQDAGLTRQGECRVVSKRMRNPSESCLNSASVASTVFLTPANPLSNWIAALMTVW